MRDTPPPDPFSGDLPDPTDPRSGGSSQFGPAGSADDDVTEPLSPAEREDVLADLEDLEVFRTLLEPRSVRGLVVDCEDCQEPHYFGWDLLHGNLRHPVSYTHLRAHETVLDLVCRLLLEKKKTTEKKTRTPATMYIKKTTEKHTRQEH